MCAHCTQDLTLTLKTQALIHSMDLHQKIRTLPTQPGCYLYKNVEGEVIYVGKAKNLRARVRSYFLAASQANAKTGTLMREAVDVDYITVANEHEALALENNLIKQRKPRFNILLRDDKTYPYIKLTMGDRFPKVFVTRRLRRDGSASPRSGLDRAPDDGQAAHGNGGERRRGRLRLSLRERDAGCEPVSHALGEDCG